MTARGKELYKTFKRSISSSVNEVLSTNNISSTGGSVSSSSSSSSSGGVKYSGGSGKAWIHPPDVLLNGVIQYTVKFLGTKEVEGAKGTDVIRDAIHAIRFQLQVKRSETGHSGAKLQKVEIQINVEGVNIMDSKTKTVLYRYPLQRISFCADDKQDKRVFSFIAKTDDDSGRHDCYVFLSDKMAEQITLTIGEAFDLAYKRFMEKNKISLENQKQSFVYRKRIAELEAENQVLSERLAEAIRGRAVHPQISLMDAPALPSTPMPIGPPPGVGEGMSQHINNDLYNNSSLNTLCTVATNDPFANLINAPSSFITPPITHVNSQNGCGPSSSGISPSGPAPSHPPPPVPIVTPVLAPPPTVASRRNITQRNNAPEVGRRLENLHMDKMDDVFDDSFDPRATQKTKDSEYDPFGDDFLDDVLATGDAAGRATVSKASAGHPTADDYQDMIDKLDRRLADMSNGFDQGTLETGEVSPGESFRDLEESEYGIPLDKVNSEIASVPKTSKK